MQATSSSIYSQSRLASSCPSKAQAQPRKVATTSSSPSKKRKTPSPCLHCHPLKVQLLQELLSLCLRHTKLRQCKATIRCQHRPERWKAGPRLRSTLRSSSLVTTTTSWISSHCIRSSFARVRFLTQRLSSSLSRELTWTGGAPSRLCCITFNGYSSSLMLS